MKESIFALCILFCLWIPALAITPWQAGSIAEAVSDGSWEASETLFRELKKSPLPPEQMPEVDYNLGVSLYHQQKFEEALPLFETAAEVNNNEELKALALYNQGNALFRLERLEEAKEAFQQALLNNPDDDDSRYNIEVILDKQKQDQQNQDEDEDQDQDSEDEQEQNKDQKNDPQSEDQDSDESENSDKDQQENEQDSGDSPENQDGENQEQEMSEAEKQAAQEAAEQARLLDYFRQQEKDGRPATQIRSQAPPVRGKTW